MQHQSLSQIPTLGYVPHCEKLWDNTRKHSGESVTCSNRYPASRLPVWHYQLGLSGAQFPPLCSECDGHLLPFLPGPLSRKDCVSPPSRHPTCRRLQQSRFFMTISLSCSWLLPSPGCSELEQRKWSVELLNVWCGSLGQLWCYHVGCSGVQSRWKRVGGEGGEREKGRHEAHREMLKEEQRWSNREKMHSALQVVFWDPPWSLLILLLGCMRPFLSP